MRLAGSLGERPAPSPQKHPGNCYKNVNKINHLYRSGDSRRNLEANRGLLQMKYAAAQLCQVMNEMKTKKSPQIVGLKAVGTRKFF